MYSCKLTVIGTLASTGESATKDFNGVNPNFIAQIGVPYAYPPPSPEDMQITGKMLPDTYASFWAWVDAVGRGINSLTTSTYNDSRITAVFSANEEEY